MELLSGGGVCRALLRRVDHHIERMARGVSAPARALASLADKQTVTIR